MDEQDYVLVRELATLRIAEHVLREASNSMSGDDLEAIRRAITITSTLVDERSERLLRDDEEGGE